MIKELVKIANRLDTLGLTKEADVLDRWVERHIKLAAGVTYDIKPNGKLYRFDRYIYLEPNDPETKNYFKIESGGNYAYKKAGYYGGGSFSYYRNMSKEVPISQAFQTLNISGYYILGNQLNTDPLSNTFFTVNSSDGSVKQIKLNKGYDPTVTNYPSHKFLADNLAYFKITAEEYSGMAEKALAMEQEGPVGPIADDQRLDLTVQEAPKDPWIEYGKKVGDAGNKVKNKWIQRSQSLGKLTTYQNFIAWLTKRKNIAPYNGKMTVDQVIAELDKDMQSAAK